MRLVPVIDLARGRAVHATGGARDRYRTVESRLAPEARGDPVRLLEAFRARLGPCPCYVADLDAIERVGDNGPTLSAMAAVPGGPLWVDAGVTGAAGAAALLASLPGSRTRVVVGTETLPDLGALAEVAATLGARRVLASVDLREGRLLWGRPGGGERPADPEAVARAARRLGLAGAIVLDLARVGSRGGPDVETIRRLAVATPGLPLFAGGGVRGPEDLASLADAGAAGALVATALHEGRLPVEPPGCH